MHHDGDATTSNHEGSITNGGAFAADIEAVNTEVVREDKAEIVQEDKSTTNASNEYLEKSSIGEEGPTHEKKSSKDGHTDGENGTHEGESMTRSEE